jgi:Flp pilus assembly pilin Flp
VHFHFEAPYTQNDPGANALEYTLILILVAFAIVTGMSAWGIGVVFELLSASRVTQVIDLVKQFV